MGRFLKYEPCPKCRDRGSDRRGDNLATYTDGSGYCFACGHLVFPKSYVRSTVNEPKNETVLPRDFTREVPGTGWKWLLQYGLPYSYWKPYCGYSPAEDRLILTVGNPVSFSVGRYLASRGSDSSGITGPSGSHRKWKQYGDRSRLVALLGDTDTDPTKRIVLVEDYISGHKVAQVTPSITLFGTNISTSVLSRLIALKRPVSLWLDEDQYGVLPSKLNRLNAVLGTSVSFIRSRKDPKEYNVEEIKEILENV